MAGNTIGNNNKPVSKSTAKRVAAQSKTTQQKTTNYNKKK